MSKGQRNQIKIKEFKSVGWWCSSGGVTRYFCYSQLRSTGSGGKGCHGLLLHILILLVPDCFAFVLYVFFTCFVYYMYLHCIPIVFLCIVFAKYLCCSQVEVVESDALSWCALCS